MPPSSTFRTELRLLLRLSTPAALSQLGLMLTGVVDVLMLARVGVDELAASALANMWQWTFMALGLGLIMGIDPLISQAHGRGDSRSMALAVQRGVVLAVFVAIPIGLAMWGTESGLLLLGQSPKIARMAADYNDWKLPGVPFFLLYTALRQYLQGRGLMAPAAWVMWFGNAANVALNWAFIFGHWGLPVGGLAGAAQASSITMLLLFVGLWAWIWGFKLQEGAWTAWSRHAFGLRGLMAVVKLGLPVGLQLSLESLAFTVATLMAGWLGESAVASHQIVLNMAALTFMVPLGVSQGAASRVGNRIGAGDGRTMRLSILASVVLGVGFMACSGVCFFTLRAQLPLLYTHVPELVALSAGILPIAAAFQISDGTQAVLGGVLRGMGRPAAGALVNLVGYFAIALPLAYVLGFPIGWGLRGVWTALALGLTLVAGALIVWVYRLAARPVEELSVYGAEPS